MKALICSLTALSLLVNSALAEDKDKDVILAKHISTTITSALPKGLSYQDRPHIRNEGAELIFFFQAENIVSFDKESFFVEGWDKHFQSSISTSGKAASITIYNRKFKGIIEELEAEGRVDVLVGTKSLTKNLKLKKGADAIEFPFFTMELSLDDNQKNAFPRQGVTVNGKHKMIKSLCIVRDGKEVRSNGSSSSNDTKTFIFRDIKDGDEIKVVYWSELKTKSVKLFK